MEKLTIEELVELWQIWEGEAGESFVDYFVDDHIRSMHFVLGYWSAKFPDLYKFLIEQGKGKGGIPWTSAQDCPGELDSISSLVEQYYGAYSYDEETGYTHWDSDNYAKAILPWCTLIIENNIYYERLHKWLFGDGTENCMIGISDETLRQFEEWKVLNSMK